MAQEPKVPRQSKACALEEEAWTSDFESTFSDVAPHLLKEIGFPMGARMCPPLPFTLFIVERMIYVGPLLCHVSLLVS